MGIAAVPPAARAAPSETWVPIRVRYYETPIQASVDQAVLEEAGIPTVLQDGEMIGMEWHLHRALGGTKIAVPSDRLSEAEELLGEAPEIPSAGEAEWLSEDEREATRAQTLGLLSLLLWPFAVYFWVVRGSFQRKFPQPSASAKRRIRRATWVASFSTLLLVVFGLMMTGVL